MKIGNTEYKFAYTVGASCDREDVKINSAQGTKRMVELALIMNKAYNDREKYYNPDFKECRLSREELLCQNADILPALDAELTEVFERDSNITVPVTPIKKKGIKAENL